MSALDSSLGRHASRRNPSSSKHSSGSRTLFVARREVFVARKTLDGDAARRVDQLGPLHLPVQHRALVSADSDAAPLARSVSSSWATSLELHAEADKLMSKRIEMISRRTFILVLGEGHADQLAGMMRLNTLVSKADAEAVESATSLRNGPSGVTPWVRQVSGWLSPSRENISKRAGKTQVSSGG